MKNIAVDSDGCAAHFDLRCYELWGKIPEHFESDETMWDHIHSVPDFFDTLPVMEEFLPLWEYLKPFNPTVITGAPVLNFERSKEQKLAWWKRHFDWDNVIVCLAKDKFLHMKQPGDILIDDRSHGCKRWTKAGGNAILYKNSAQTIADIESENYFQLKIAKDN